jgi:hypothetical protein
MGQFLTFLAASRCLVVKQALSETNITLWAGVAEVCLFLACSSRSKLS